MRRRLGPKNMGLSSTVKNLYFYLLRSTFFVKVLCGKESCRLLALDPRCPGHGIGQYTLPSEAPRRLPGTRLATPTQPPPHTHDHSNSHRTPIPARAPPSALGMCLEENRSAGLRVWGGCRRCCAGRQGVPAPRRHALPPAAVADPCVRDVPRHYSAGGNTIGVVCAPCLCSF